MQRPDVIRVLCAPLNSTAQAEIIATDLLRLTVMALFGQQGRKRMPRRMHPGPRLDVFQIVVSIDGFPQMGVATFMIALVVFKFAIEHLLAYRQYAVRAVVEDFSFRRRFGQITPANLTARQADAFMVLESELAREIRDGEQIARNTFG